jgi:hypothetical protein
MRYLEAYKIFETYKPLIEIKLKDGNVLRYKDEWKTSRSKERHEITKYLMDVFQELKDDRYVVNDGGWMAGSSYPHIWISSRRRREGMDWDIVDDYVSSARDYLESVGFVTEVEKLGSNQMYLYFDKDPKSFDKVIKESIEPVESIIDHVNSMMYDMEDLGYAYIVDGYEEEDGDYITVHLIRNEKDTILIEDIDYRIDQIRDIIKYKLESVKLRFVLSNRGNKAITINSLEDFNIKDEIDNGVLKDGRFSVLEYGMNEWLDDFSYGGKDGDDYKFKSDAQFDDLELFINENDIETDVRPVIKEIIIVFKNEVPEKI